MRQARSAADIKHLHNQPGQVRFGEVLATLLSCAVRNSSVNPTPSKQRPRFAKKLKYHCLDAIAVVKQTHYSQPGRPRKDTQPQVSYQVRATLVRNQAAIEEVIACSGRFILATNVTEKDLLSAEQVMLRVQRAAIPRAGVSRCREDPLFFT